MQFNEECIACLIHRQAALAEGHGTEQSRLSFMKDVLQAVLDAPEGVAAPFLIPAFTQAYARHFGIDDPYRQIKRDSNERVMAFLPEIRAMLRRSNDPLRLAMQFSQTGNFLDFAVLPREKIEQELESAIRKTPENPLPEEEYGMFLAELSRARSVLILGDNAGEIAFDRVLVEELLRQYPSMRICYCVRGKNAQNDATREDAAFCGMDRLVPVVDNGSAIPGTELSYCSKELLCAMEQADLILSKGQANFETLLGCGKNIYYLFLCKCPRFARRFGVPVMTGLFVNERRCPEI